MPQIFPANDNSAQTIKDTSSKFCRIGKLCSCVNTASYCVCFVSEIAIVTATNEQ